MPSIALNGRKYGINGANGKNVVVAKIEPIIGGNRITFLHYDDNNVQQSSTLDVMNGMNGASIVSAKIENGNNLILELSNGTTIDAGFITLNVEDLDISLDNYYTKTDIDTLLANQKRDLEAYVDEKVDEVVSDTVDTVTPDDILNLFS